MFIPLNSLSGCPVFYTIAKIMAGPPFPHIESDTPGLNTIGCSNSVIIRRESFNHVAINSFVFKHSLKSSVVTDVEV